MIFPFAQLPLEFLRGLFAAQRLDLSQSWNAQFHSDLQRRIDVARGIKRLGIGLEQGQHDLVATDVPVVVNLPGDVPEVFAAAHRAVGVPGQGGQRRRHSQQEDAGQDKPRVHGTSKG